MPHPPAPRRQTLSLDRPGAAGVAGRRRRGWSSRSSGARRPACRTGGHSGPATDSRRSGSTRASAGWATRACWCRPRPAPPPSRAWLSAPFAADVETSAAVYLNSAVPVHLFVRGSDLDTATPTYYAVAVTRGAEVQLLKVVDGKTTVLGSVRSDEYLTNRWATVTVRAEGDQLKVTLHRGDTNQYLDADGEVEPPADRRRPGHGPVDQRRRAGRVRPAGEGRGGHRAGQPARRAPKATTAPDHRGAVRPRPRPAGRAGRSGPRRRRPRFRTFGDETLRVDAGSDSTARGLGQRPDRAGRASLVVDLRGQPRAGRGLRPRVEPRHQPRRPTTRLTVTRGLEVKLWKVVGGAATPLGHRPVAGLAQRPVGADVAGPRRRPAPGAGVPVRHRAVPAARRHLGAGPDLRR